MISGKIYYSSGILLEDDFYVITNKNSSLGQATTLSNEINMLLFVIKDKFINDFNIKEFKNQMKVKTTLTKNILKMLDKKHLKLQPFYFFELLTSFFKATGMVDTKNFSFSKIVYDENLFLEINDFILKNINLSTQAIELALEKDLNISSKVINKYCIEKLNITLRKLILKIKLKKVIEKKYFNNDNIINLISEYSLENIKQVRYNLKSHFNLSIKNLNYCGGEKNDNS